MKTLIITIVFYLLAQSLCSQDVIGYTIAEVRESYPGRFVAGVLISEQKYGNYYFRDSVISEVIIIFHNPVGMLEVIKGFNARFLALSPVKWVAYQSNGIASVIELKYSNTWYVRAEKLK